MVRTLASHAGIRGSNPLGGAKTNKKTRIMRVFLFVFMYYMGDSNGRE